MSEECYSTGYECQIVDNFAFRIQTGRIYQTVLNPAGDCCVSIPDLVLTRRFGRTFGENDPYRKIKNGEDPTEAAFDDKIDGHYFRPDICLEQQVDTDLNIEPINFLDYSLESTKTKRTDTVPVTSEDVTVTGTNNSITGKLYIRNSTGSKIDSIDNMLPGLYNLPEIYNNITSFNIVYDNILLYTPTELYIDQVNYDYSTGEFESSTTTPVRLTVSADRRERIMRSHFDPDSQVILTGRTAIVDNKLVVPQLYKYNANTHLYSIAYDGVAYKNDHIKLALPPDIYRDFVICNVDTPIICYNDKIQKYSVVTVAALSATQDAIVRAGEHDSLLGEFYCVVVYNFKNYETGLELIDSTIFHAPNKRQLKHKELINTQTIELSASDEFINVGLITDPGANFTLNFRNAPVRVSKLKHVSVTYNGTKYIKNRLPVNDMLYADLPHIKDMVDGYVPHASGGPIDFASPRYQDITVNLDLNLRDISVVSLSGEAVYYDGHVETYKLFGEARPLPLANVLGHMSLVEVSSYTTDTKSNLLKCTFETKKPNYLTDIIIDNGSLAETTSDLIVQRNIMSPVLSTTPASGETTSDPTAFTDWSDNAPWLDSNYWNEQ